MTKKAGGILPAWHDLCVFASLRGGSIPVWFRLRRVGEWLPAKAHHYTLEGSVTCAATSANTATMAQSSGNQSPNLVYTVSART
jgi:hypothetical protein